MRSSIVCLCVIAAALTQARPAGAQQQQQPPQQQQNEEDGELVASKRLGVGYKIGNGLGFVGGDVIVSPIDHLTLDLQANWFAVSSNGTSANGYGIAPAAQFHLFKGQVSSPYIGLGYVYASLTLDGVTASASGAFANVGYEWRWRSGLGILLGGGVGYLGTVRATNGVETVESPGGTHFNLETGLRFMFL
ncbi:MAG TPA: hypothetical protein VIF57_13125 [Polyangia bacterium]|jgi:hypothetical protein